jgi:3-hydroxy-9,10-secoandrosta-1,3,5(10)-triene-9,17-dione monooxygenase
MTTTTLRIPTRAELVARARDLQPLLRKHVADGEVHRRQSDEVIDALTSAGLFRLFTPRRFGGYSTSLRTQVDVTEALAEADGSAAWVVGISTGGAWVGAHATERVQEEVFGPDPDVRISGSANPAPARRVDGGLRADGRWAYASGSPHSSWAGVAMAVADDQGQPGGAYFSLVPRSDLSLEATWQTVGMRGTGSLTWVGDDLFVPEYRTLALAEVFEGSPDHDEPLYRLPFAPVATLNLMGTLLGMGRTALDYTIEKAPTKAMHHTFFARQSDSVAVQVQTAQAALKLQTARLHTYRIADDLDAAAINGGTLDYSDRAQIRAEVGYSVQQVLEAIQILLNVHGAAGFAETSPLQQIWRDANTGGRHAGFNAAVGYEVFGKALLGVPERISAMV